MKALSLFLAILQSPMICTVLVLDKRKSPLEGGLGVISSVCKADRRSHLQTVNVAFGDMRGKCYSSEKRGLT